MADTLEVTGDGPLIALVIAVPVAGLTTLAAVLTPLAGLALVVLGAWALQARG